MQMTTDIENLISHVAAHQARCDIAVAESKLSAEMREGMITGTLAEASQMLDAYQADRCNLYDGGAVAARRALIVVDKKAKVGKCLPPALEPPPCLLTAEDIPDNSPGLIGLQWHHVIPIWGMIAHGVDSNRDHVRRQSMADKKNAER